MLIFSKNLIIVMALPQLSPPEPNGMLKVLMVEHPS